MANDRQRKPIKTALLCSSLKTEVFKLDFCHSSVWVMPDETLNIEAIEVVPKAVECSRRINSLFVSMPHQFVMRVAFRVALDLRADKLIGSICWWLGKAFESLNVTLPFWRAVNRHPSNSLAGLLVMFSQFEIGRIRLVVLYFSAREQRAIADHAASAIEFNRGLTFSVEDPLCSWINLVDNAAAVSIPISLKDCWYLLHAGLLFCVSEAVVVDGDV